MVLRELGSTGVQVPAVGQGTWRMGEDPARDRQAIEALRLGVELGMTLIDTAEMYAGGRAETLVGQAVADIRDRVFIVSKVLPEHASYEGVLRAARASLRRLRTGWIDLYLIHWPSERHPVEQTMRAMEKLACDGLVRYVGVSNFTVEEFEQAQRALGERPLVCNQVYYWLGERAVERHVLPHCERRHVTLMAYSPFGSGNFPHPSSPKGQVLARVAARYGRTPHQVALNWLVHRSPAVVAIPKAERPEHVRDNAGAVGWQLAPEDVEELERAFPAPAGKPPLPML